MVPVLAATTDKEGKFANGNYLYGAVRKYDLKIGIYGSS
jgi:hypothetical protein